MLLKNSRGSVLEDIDQYDVLTRIKANMKTKCRLQSEAEGSKKLQNDNFAENLAGSFFGARYCGTCREQRDVDPGGL